MKNGILFTIVGITMVALGLTLFYSIQSPVVDSLSRSIKHAGTFMGLMGIGVTMAGILLYLINRNQPTLKEKSDPGIN